MPLERRARPSERGQVLPLALAGFVASTLCFLFLVKAGGLLIQRERASMRTDVTALSIGVDYARALNLLSATNKLVGTGHIATLIPGIGAGARKAVEALQKVQTLVMHFGPWITEASALQLGAQNGLVAMPLWNTRDLIKDFSQDSLKPSYRVEAIGLFGEIADSLSKWLDLDVKEEDVAGAAHWGEKEAKEFEDGAVLDKVAGLARTHLPGVDLSWLLKKAGYSYQPKDGGARVYVPEDAGHTGPERKAGGGMTERSHEDQAHKYVHVEKEIAGDLPFMLKDLDGHSITLIAPFLPALDPEAKAGQPWIWSIAQVRIQGGDMDYLSMESMEYRPYFIPLRLTLPSPGARSSRVIDSLPFDQTLFSNAPGTENALSTAVDILAIQH